MNTQDVKEILGIDYYNEKHDEYITTVIPLFTDFVKEYCNNQFSGSDDLPGGVQLVISKMIEYNMNKAGVSSKSFGEVSYSYSVDFPSSILKMLQPYLRIRV